MGFFVVVVLLLYFATCTVPNHNPSGFFAVCSFPPILSPPGFSPSAFSFIPTSSFAWSSTFSNASPAGLPTLPVIAPTGLRALSAIWPTGSPMADRGPACLVSLVRNWRWEAILAFRLRLLLSGTRD